MAKPSSTLPLVYACSGCSSVAQLANTMALRLDRQGKAEMSCIAGVGGGVPALLKVAHSGRPILALDGCALACAKACLDKAGVAPDTHLILNREGAKKKFHADCSASESETVWRRVETAADGLLAQSVGDAKPEDGYSAAAATAAAATTTAA